MRSASFAHSRKCLVSPTSTPIGHIIHARRIPASFTMFSRRALAGHRRRRKFRDFTSISSNCSLPLHHSLHLHRLQGLTGCCPGSHMAACIACRLLPEVGVIPPASRWPVPGCALTTIRLHQRMTHSTGSPLCGFPSREQPNDMASHVPAPCMSVTEFRMLVPVAVLAFRSLALARGVERHNCPRRVLFVSSLISVTRIYF